MTGAGLPLYHGLHSLRHTYGSGLISRGVSPAFVRQQMGHASIQQTVDTYGSWLPVRVPGAVDDFADAVSTFSVDTGVTGDSVSRKSASRGGHQMDTLPAARPRKAKS